MTLIESIQEASAANLPLTLTHDKAVELAALIAEDSSSLADDLRVFADQPQGGIIRYSASEIKYIASLI